LGGIWFLPLISSAGAINWLDGGVKLLKFVDQGWVEILGGQGVSTYKTHKGVIFDYRLLRGLKLYLFGGLLVIFIILYYNYLNSLNRA